MLKVSLTEILKYVGGIENARSIVEGENLVDAQHLMPPGVRGKTADSINIFALCLQSSALSKDPHGINGDFKIIGKRMTVTKITCSCVAGINGQCKHSVALLIYCSQNDVATFQDLSCTDVECSWKQQKKTASSRFAPVPRVVQRKVGLVMSSYQNNVPQNQLSYVNDVLPGQNAGQQNLPTDANKVSYSQFVSDVSSQFSYLSGRKESGYVMGIVLLLHANKCQKRYSTNGEESGECKLSNCQEACRILSHIKVCQAGTACTFPMCASSKGLLMHWKNCTGRECVVCWPFKHSYELWVQYQPRFVLTSQSYQARVQRIYSSLELPFPSNSGDSNLQNQALTQMVENSISELNQSVN